MSKMGGGKLVRVEVQISYNVLDVQPNLPPVRGEFCSGRHRNTRLYYGGGFRFATVKYGSSH